MIDDSPKAVAVLVIGALAALIALRHVFGNVSVKVG